MTNDERKRQRALFETWAGNAQFNTERVGDGSYWSGPTHVAHRAWLAACEANAVGEPCKCGFKRLAADKMAAVLDDWVYRDIIDPRSAAADARLSYGEPFSHEEVNHILGRPLDAPFERSVIGEPSDIETLRQACRDLLAIVADAIMHGMPITTAVADARNRAVAALAKREERG